MKRTFLTFFLLSLSFWSFSQVTYVYDAAGNRVSRQIVISKSKQDLSIDSKFSVNEVVPTEDNVGKLRFSIYPNPVVEEVNVDISNFPSEVSSAIQVLNSAGKVVYEKKNLSEKNSFNFSSQAPGVYVLRVTCGKEFVNWKIIKN